MLSRFSRVPLFANLCMDCSLPGSSVHEILQTRILERVAMPSSGDLPSPGMEPASLRSSALAGGLPLVPPGKPKGVVSVSRAPASPIKTCPFLCSSCLFYAI